jgi:hypothetical protein
MAGFYLKPAIVLAENHDAFAAGVLVVCAIDALALLSTGASACRITAFCKKIPDLAADDNARIFCESFRNGLVHQARVKNGSEFSTDNKRIAIRNDDRLIVNPKLLAQAVLKLLDEYVATLHCNLADKTAFCKWVKRKFRYELKH